LSYERRDVAVYGTAAATDQPLRAEHGTAPTATVSAARSVEPMRLILVRHGEAHAGLHGVVPGPRGCAGLTAHGRRQAERLRDRLLESPSVRADVLLASVLPRAVETAEIIAPGLGFDAFSRDCDLCEVHTGEADGLEWSDYSIRYGPLDMAAEPDRLFAPAGESWNSFHDRVHRTLERLARDHADQTVVAVCHAGVIMASVRSLLGVPHPGTGARLQPTNTGLTEWEHEPALDRWTLHTFNDASHLVDRAPAG
jgi:broad specificity phosphatase PhoE